MFESHRTQYKPINGQVVHWKMEMTLDSNYIDNNNIADVRILLWSLLI